MSGGSRVSRGDEWFRLSTPFPGRASYARAAACVIKRKPRALARGRYDRYAAFLCCLTFAQRARCAAAILLRPARLIVRTGVGTARLVFAHRAFCASEIFLRAAADSVRFELFILIRMPVPFRPTKLPMTWMTWSRRLRSCSSSFNTPARSAMYSPSRCLE
jgi:hypothetical protein